ncbi:unnamed protein product [Prunus brigantina]
MNGFSLQSTTTPKKACKGIESAPGGPIEAEKDMPEGRKISAWWSLIGASG